MSATKLLPESQVCLTVVSVEDTSFPLLTWLRTKVTLIPFLICPVASKVHRISPCYGSTLLSELLTH